MGLFESDVALACLRRRCGHLMSAIGSALESPENAQEMLREAVSAVVAERATDSAALSGLVGAAVALADGPSRVRREDLDELRHAVRVFRDYYTGFGVESDARRVRARRAAEKRWAAS